LERVELECCVVYHGNHLDMLEAERIARGNGEGEGVA
jgi:hypothetical protein